MFALVVDDFEAENTRKEHVKCLITTFEECYEITEDWKVDFWGTHLEWNYSQGAVRLSIKICIIDILQSFYHVLPRKPQHYPHPRNQPTLGDKNQYSPRLDASTKLNEDGVKSAQIIKGILLCYARSVEDKLMVALGTIST